MSAEEDPTGAGIATHAADALRDKAMLDWPRMAALAVAAGAFIAFGGIAFLIVQASPAVTGPVQLLSGVAFASGLMMVLVTGSELFTGNVMFTLPAANGRLSGGRLARAWMTVWLGNLAGSLVVAGLFVAAGGPDGLDGAVGRAAIAVAEEKARKGALATIASGVLANMLVCLAVWMAIGARSLSATAIALVGPVAVFVAAGLEHSIANMSLLPIGLLAGAQAGWADIGRNLAFSTMGNIVGGTAIALGLGLAHRSEGAD